MNRHIAFLAITAGMVAACQPQTVATQPQAQVCERGPCSFQDTIPSSVGWTERGNRTSMFLGMLQGRILAYLGAHGSLPLQLQDALAGPGPAIDAWNRAFSYSRTDTAYEIRSAGADARFHTADDVYFTAHVDRQLPCVIVAEGRRQDFSDGDSRCAMLMNGLQIQS